VKPKRQRLVLIIGMMAALGIAVAFMLIAFEDNLVFFHSPSDVVEKDIGEGKRFRLGGMVEEDSVVKSGVVVTFKVTDFNQSIPVRFEGLLPDLFREGQGVVAEGRIDSRGIFVADTVLAKHDENYMPPEVADALARQGIDPAHGQKSLKQ
jgi:cytochrome c-type biogenesis protein CcmE